jgi:hypothetical protein
MNGNNAPSLAKNSRAFFPVCLVGFVFMIGMIKNELDKHRNFH